MNIIKPSVKLLHATPQSLMVHAGRHSYQSFDKTKLSDEQLLYKFAKHKEGPLKFSFAMFDIECSYATHAHYRTHNHLVQNWLSQRYTEGVGVVVPEGFNEEQRAAYLEGMEAVQRCFQALRELGATKQDARYIQAQGVAIRGSVAANAMGWTDILALRTAKKAMPETRQIARMLYNALREAWPDATRIITDPVFVKWAKEQEEKQAQEVAE